MSNNKNIQMKYSNGVDWDNLFPKTKASLVSTDGGITVEAHISDLVSHITQLERNTWNAKATQQDIGDAIKALVGTSPDTLDTLQEIAAALNNDPNFAATIVNQLATKVDKVVGKSLSQEDFTSVLKAKLEGIAESATKVQASTNGKIKINGVDVDVYVHPTGTNPHKTTKSDVGLGSVENKSSATIRGEITASNISTALGFTPTKITIGLESSRPSATGSKGIYITTDSNKIFLDNASNEWKLVGGADSVAWSSVTGKPTTLSGYGITDAAPSSHVGSGGSAHAVATQSTAGFISAADKTKLDALKNYSHLTGDGNLHVPETSTTNNKKVLKAGATAGSIAWGSVDWSEVANKPSTLTPSAHTHAASEITESATKRFVSDTEKATWNGKTQIAVSSTQPTSATIWFEEV